MKTLQYCLKCPVCETRMNDGNDIVIGVKTEGVEYTQLWMHHTRCLPSTGFALVKTLREFRQDMKSDAQYLEDMDLWHANGIHEIDDACSLFRQMPTEVAHLVHHNSNPNKGVYLLQCDEYYKIGVGDNVTQRVKQIQTATPYQVLHLLTLPSKNPYALERTLHARFASKRVRGEWFALTDSDVAYIKGL